MTILLVVLCLLLAFSLLNNGLALTAFRKQAAGAIRVYKPSEKAETARKLILGTLGVLSLFALVALRVLRVPLGLNLTLCLAALSLLCFLYGFAPFSDAYWCFTPDGLYSYRKRKLIPWSQMIKTGTLKKRRRTFLTLEVKKVAGEVFKEVYYAFPLPAEQAEEARALIRDFLGALEKQKYLKKVKEEKNTPLNKRKWY